MQRSWTRSVGFRRTRSLGGSNCGLDLRYLFCKPPPLFGENAATFQRNLDRSDTGFRCVSARTPSSVHHYVVGMGARYGVGAAFAEDGLTSGEHRCNCGSDGGEVGYRGNHAVERKEVGLRVCEGTRLKFSSRLFKFELERFLGRHQVVAIDIAFNTPHSPHLSLGGSSRRGRLDPLPCSIPFRDPQVFTFLLFPLSLPRIIVVSGKPM